MMNDGDGKQLLENTPRVDVEKILNDPPVRELAKIPSGCVERILSIRERNYIIGACRAFCESAEHRNLKDQSNLSRLNKILVFEETLEYIAMLDDAQEELTRKWTRHKQMYKLWRDYQEGLIKDEELKKELPDVDLNEGIKKPPLRAPENRKDEMHGRERPFHLPSKIDAWVQDALRSMKWSWATAEYSVTLCEKFGIKDGDAG